VHFARRARLLRRDLSVLLRRGAISLAIGLAFLATFLAIAHFVARMLGERPLTALFREGLLIVGWVAMWKPLEIFLYDWWPILGEQRLHERLSRIRVRIVRDGATAVRAAESHAGLAPWPIALEPRPSVGAAGPQPPDAEPAIARWENEGGRVLTRPAEREAAARS
jgi:hypothetical protein